MIAKEKDCNNSFRMQMKYCLLNKIVRITNQKRTL